MKSTYIVGRVEKKTASFTLHTIETILISRVTVYNQSSETGYRRQVGSKILLSIAGVTECRDPSSK